MVRVDELVPNEPHDLDARRRWPRYEAAYEQAIQQTSTPWAPWQGVPADRRWSRDVGGTIP